MRIAAITLTLGLLAIPAFGQSINIDVGGGGTPPNTFAGATGQAGTWNNFATMPASPVPLLGLNGSPSGVTFTATVLGGMSGFNDVGAPSSNFNKLMMDGWRLIDKDDRFIFDFQGLEPGVYFLYTFADTPFTQTKDSQVGTIELDEFGLIEAQEAGGWYAAGTFVTHVTHTRHYFDLPEGGRIGATIRRNDISGAVRGVVNGFQIHKLPRRLYVDGTATGTGNGLSWQNAFTKFEDAVEAVPDYGPAIQEIWVADGTYYPTDGIHRGATFHLANGVKIYGGFAGNETSLDQRDPQAHVSTLSGSIGGMLPYDNSYHVIDTRNNTATAVLDGFTVMNGYADGPFGWDDRGGGMYIKDGSPTIRNCRFIVNYAEFGGAIYVENGAPTIVNCLFQNNTADEGGGAIEYDNLAGTATMRVAHSRFLSNTSYWNGGAIDVLAGSAWISNCIFTGSWASQDGGAVRVNGSSATAAFYNCSAVGNYAHRYGGGICVDSDGFAALSNTILWTNNTSTQPNTNLAGQLAAVSGGTVSAAYSCVRGYTPAALPGAGNVGMDPQFVNANGGDTYGDLNDDLRLSATSPLIDAGNSLATGSDIIDSDGDGITIEPMPFDLDRLPRLVDYFAAPNTGNGSVPVDMGAYERQALPVLLGDMDCNGAVNLADVSAMSMALLDVSHYNQTFGCIQNGDFTGNGIVDGRDLQGFVNLLTP